MKYFLVIKINGYLSKLSLAGSILVRSRLVEKGILIREITLILTDRKEVHKNTCLDQALNIIEAPSNYMMSMRTSSAEDAVFSPEGSWRMVLLWQEAGFQLRVWIKWEVSKKRIWRKKTCNRVKETCGVSSS